MKRKLKLSRPAKSAPVKGKKTGHPAIKAVKFTPEAREKSIKAMAREVIEKTTKRPKSERMTHGVAVNYEGLSSPVNRNKSRTRIPVEEFGSKPDSVLTERVNALLKAIKAKYGSKPFRRGDFNAGALKRAGWKGVLVHVSGDPASEDCVFRLAA